MITYENAVQTMERWLHDVRPALHEPYAVTCVDNSRGESASLGSLFGDGYYWMGGANLLYGPSLNFAVRRLLAADLLLYVCTRHGRVLDVSWVDDLLTPLRADSAVGMAGTLTSSARPDEFGAEQYFRFDGPPPVHVQGGVFAARADVMRRLPYPPKWPHLYTDHLLTWAMLQEGWRVVDVPTIRSVYHARVTDVADLKYIHDYQENP